MQRVQIKFVLAVFPNYLQNKHIKDCPYIPTRDDNNSIYLIQ